MLRDTLEPDIKISPLTQAGGVCPPEREPSAKVLSSASALLNREAKSKPEGEPSSAAQTLSGPPLSEIRDGIILESSRAKINSARVSLLLEYLLFMMIPIAGIIIALIWAFNNKGCALRRNLARAMLIAMIIMLLLYLVMALVLAPYFAGWLYGKWQEDLFWIEDGGLAPPPQNSRAPDGVAIDFKPVLSQADINES